MEEDGSGLKPPRPPSRSAHYPEAEEIVRARAEAETNRLTKSLSVETDLVVQVLRVHLLFEHHLERLITAGLPRGDRLTSDRMSFSQKLQVVHALDVLPDGAIGALRGLNRLRNDCAHQLDKEITQGDIERIGLPLGKRYHQIRVEHHDSLAAQFVMVAGLTLELLLTQIISYDVLITGSGAEGDNAPLNDDLPGVISGVGEKVEATHAIVRDHIKNAFMLAPVDPAMSARATRSVLDLSPPWGRLAWLIAAEGLDFGAPFNLESALKAADPAFDDPTALLAFESYTYGWLKSAQSLGAAGFRSKRDSGDEDVYKVSVLSLRPELKSEIQAGAQHFLTSDDTDLEFGAWTRGNVEAVQAFFRGLGSVSEEASPDEG